MQQPLGQSNPVLSPSFSRIEAIRPPPQWKLNDWSPPKDYETLSISRTSFKVASVSKFGALLPAYPEIEEVMRFTGVHPQSGKVTLYDPYQGVNVSDCFNNMGYHLLCVAGVAGSIAARLSSASYCFKETVVQAYREALCHDIGKPFDLRAHRAQAALRKESTLAEKNDHMRRIKAAGAQMNGNDEVILSVRANLARGSLVLPEGFDYLRMLGLIGKSGENTGHDSVQRFLTVDADDALVLRPDSKLLVGKIVHLADLMVVTANQISPEEPDSTITDPLARYILMQAAKRYEHIVTNGLAWNSNQKRIMAVNEIASANSLIESRVSELAKLGIIVLGTYHDLNLKMAHAICSEFAMALSGTKQADPMEYMLKVVADAMHENGSAGL